MNIKKEIKEWGVFVVIIGILYFTGLHTEVAAFAQRMVLSTGFIKPDLEMDTAVQQTMDYSFDLSDLEGNITPMSEFKGKVLFINEWATWCGPCIAEMPGIQELYNTIGEDENIEFIMLSLDESRTKASKFIKRKDFTFPVYGATSRLPKVLQSSSIPTTFVVSKEGEIIYRNVGMAKYDTEEFINFMKETAAQ